MADRLILIVDDEEMIRELIADVLIDEGYRVELAANGRDALRVIDRVLPTLILIDLHMPLLDGFSFVRELAARGVVVPTILVSAALDLAEHAVTLGAVAWIGNPFAIAHLLTTVARHYPAA